MNRLPELLPPELASPIGQHLMRLVNLDQLEPAARLGDAVFGPTGQMLLARGVELTDRYVERLRSIGVPAVYVLDADTSDVQLPWPISPEARARTLNNLTKAFDHLAKAAHAVRQATSHHGEEITPERFAAAMAAAHCGDPLSALANDVDLLIKELTGRQALLTLNSIKTHDRYTVTHALDVAIMGIVLGQKAGWEKQKLKTFGLGCLFHDLGHVLIDAELSNKAGPLTPDEFEKTKAHTTMAYEVIRAISPKLGPLVAQVALQHHERHDGSGYLRGLTGNERMGVNEAGRIHDFGALCAIADIYDAMTSHRPYRPARAAHDAVQSIESAAGKQLHAEVVRLFLSAVTPYPMCTSITVCNGKYKGWKGIVVGVAQELLNRPTVRLLYDEHAQRTSPVELNLESDRDVEITGVDQTGGPTAESRGSVSGAKTGPKDSKHSYTIPQAVLVALRKTS